MAGDPYKNSASWFYNQVFRDQALPNRNPQPNSHFSKVYGSGQPVLPA